MHSLEFERLLIEHKYGLSDHVTDNSILFKTLLVVIKELRLFSLLVQASLIVYLHEFPTFTDQFIETRPGEVEYIFSFEISYEVNELSVLRITVLVYDFAQFCQTELWPK